MPITRSELIARSLVHADKVTHGSISLPALVDHTHFNHLSPEEKAAVIQHYAELTGGRGNDVEQGHLDTIATGAKKGLLASIIPALASGALTLPSLLAIRAATGNKEALKDVLRRTLIPVAAVSGVGAATGIFSQYMERANAAADNKYIAKMLEGIHQEQDPQEKQIKSMSLVATAPYLNRKLQGSEALGPNIRSHIFSRLLDPEFAETSMSKMLGQDTYTNEDGMKNYAHYKDWNYVRGVAPDQLKPKGTFGERHWKVEEIKK